MKKLNLKLGSKEMLSKDQMKQISGGYGTCKIYCCWGGPGSCSSGVAIPAGCYTNEDCQDIGNYGWECQDGAYLAGLCFSE